MVAKGLTVGARFEDNGLCYEVQAVNSDGTYISKKVDKDVLEVEPKNVPQVTENSVETDNTKPHRRRKKD